MKNREDRIAKRYLGIGLMIVILLWMAGLTVSALRPEWGIQSPVWVSTAFSVAILVAFALAWKWVSSKHTDSLPTLYSLGSGFRMLAALFTLVGCFLAVGRDAMVPYVLVFLIFYMVIVAFHTIYFMRINNRQL